MSDVLALYAVGLLHDYLPAVCDGRGDQGAWEKVVLAGMVAGMVSAETGYPMQQGLQRISQRLKTKVDEKVLLAVMPV